MIKGYVRKIKNALEFEKKIDATSNAKGKQVYFAVVEKNGRNLLTFEPPREMLEMIQKYSRSKVHICEE